MHLEGKVAFSTEAFTRRSGWFYISDIPTKLWKFKLYRRVNYPRTSYVEAEVAAVPRFIERASTPLNTAVWQETYANMRASAKAKCSNYHEAKHGRNECLQTSLLRPVYPANHLFLLLFLPCYNYLLPVFF